MAGRALPQIILEQVDEEEEDRRESVGNEESTLERITVNEYKYSSEGRSASPSLLSIGSRSDFLEARIDDQTMAHMMKLATLNEGQSRFGTSWKYLNRQSMTEYTKASSICQLLEKISSLTHKRIARFFGYHRSETHLTMFRVFVPSGTIADKLKRGTIAESLAIKYFKQLLEGLDYLHERNIVHGNVKTTNILITLSNDIQLTDMALHDSPRPDVHRRRTLFFSAPELFKTRNSLEKTTRATDVWAAGCILVSMVTRFPPFKDHFIRQTTDELYERLLVAHSPSSSSPSPSQSLSYRSDTLIPTATHVLCEMVDAAFTISPSSRYTAAQMLDRFYSPSSSQSASPSQLPSDHSSDPSNRKETVLNHDDLYNDAPMPRDDQKEMESLISYSLKEEEEESPLRDCSQWYFSRILIFGSLLLKWIAMVLLAAFSLAMVAGSVFLAIFVIYNGIGVVCQCNLNEGFIVLIALILLPIIILLTTLCCNNSCEKYKLAEEDGRLEQCSYVTAQPEDDVLLCGIIVVDGKKEQRKLSVRRKVASPEESDPTAASNLPKTAFVRGVARIA